jgi:hypothetical protein
LILLVAAGVAAVGLLAGEAGARASTVTVTVEIQGSGKVTAPGIDCGLGATKCETSIAGTTAMNFVATPGDKSVFAAWLGDCSGNTSPCILVIPDHTDVLVRAVFAYVEVVSVQPQGTGQGRVVSQPAGIDCPDACAKAYGGDTSVTLTAIPKQGSTFTGWGGWCSGTSLTCNLKATGTAWAVAHFESKTKPANSTGGGGSAANGFVFTPTGWDIQNPDGIRYVVVQFRTSLAGWVGFKVKRGGQVYSRWRIFVQPGPVTVRLPLPATAPKGPYTVYATIATAAGRKSATWQVKL